MNFHFVEPTFRWWPQAPTVVPLIVDGHQAVVNQRAKVASLLWIVGLLTVEYSCFGSLRIGAYATTFTQFVLIVQASSKIGRFFLSGLSPVHNNATTWEQKISKNVKAINRNTIFLKDFWSSSVRSSKGALSIELKSLPRLLENLVILLY